jgi:DNA-binding response OmpR family regulator
MIHQSEDARVTSMKGVFYKTMIQLRQEALMVPRIPEHQIHFDADHSVVSIDDHAIDCLQQEFELLRYLLMHYQQIVTYTDLIKQVWGSDMADSRHIKKAHRKLINTVSDLRIKLWKCEFTIVGAVLVGYALVHQSQLWNTQCTQVKTQQSNRPLFTS